MNNAAKPTIELGYYQHYKGRYYQVTALAQHSETLEWLVIYRALYGDYGLWARPAGMFSENVLIAGEEIPRFQFLSAALPAELDDKASELPSDATGQM
ncbi:DUF1653 domain-containing protein [Alishewanella tabrizica]|uniref:DUF1653 domain-containing protein n=1 Tax=Alishewanella tabrizica TaxID=671278 RepID=A0ABQ2WDA8_9ALTE|nr:DUF1653 domain-containing protein [Alishewanella tabrizica]GGW49644.1 hypothetical protein GCM10008111_01730 [Alishewanella tabrizica]